MMTNQQAYGNRSYEERAATTYQPGDIVEIGPAYMAGGTYRQDGMEGVYTVVQVVQEGARRSYELARGFWYVPDAAGNPPAGAHWMGKTIDRIDLLEGDVNCYATRLTKIEVET